MKEHVLVGESFSPWTQKARWALEHAGIAHAYQEYVPTLSEPGLRWRLRQFSGPVSVPVLFVDGRALRGSWEIARYANDHTRGRPLGDMARVAPWNELSEAALAEGRTRVVRGVMTQPAALDEALAAIFPRVLARHLRFVARDAARRLDRKYAYLVVPGSLRKALEQARAGLQRSTSGFLLGTFSYADICMVAVLEVVSPLAQADPPLGPATRACWSDPALASEFADLLAWRKGIVTAANPRYSQYR
jgi:glutathione S-transferase